MSVISNKRGVFIHRLALVESSSVGKGTRIWAFTHVMSGTVVGEHCNIGEQCYVETGAVIGDFVTIKNLTAIWKGVTIENNCFVGPGVRFTNDLYPRPGRAAAEVDSHEDRWLVPTLVERGASIGAGAVILAGVTLGEYCMVGAGAVVTKSVAPYALVTGCPARQRGWVCRCGCSLRSMEPQTGKWVCSSCEATYTEQASVLLPNTGTDT